MRPTCRLRLQEEFALVAPMPSPLACPPCPPQQTNDDAITVTTMPVILDITSKSYNPQGCEIPAT